MPCFFGSLSLGRQNPQRKLPSAVAHTERKAGDADVRKRTAKGSLPEIFCLWASEPYSLLCHNIKYLAGKIRKSNWATPWNARWPLPLVCIDDDAGKLGVESLPTTKRVVAWESVS
jgi:hypothetical protein